MPRTGSFRTLRDQTLTTDSPVAWFCVRSQPKHEQIAAAHLRRLEKVDVFSPRIRFRRATRQGSVWVTESLFPNYLFARFDWQKSLARVQYSAGVSTVVHFGKFWPIVPDQVITGLRATLGPEELHVIPPTLEAGDEVRISGGAFHGLHAVILRVMPARERVAVLLDFLGHQTTVELELKSVIKRAVHPLRQRQEP